MRSLSASQQFKDTPAGTIPVDWQSSSFGALAEFRNGLNYTETESGFDASVLGVGDFQDLFRFDPKNIQRICINARPPVDATIERGDLIFVRSNGNRALIGRVLYFAEVPQEIYHSGFTIRARIKDQTIILPEFAARFFQSDSARKEIARFGGGTNISNLSQELLSKVVLPLPTIAEQAAICQIVDSCDKTIESFEQLAIARKDQRRGLMQQLLTGGRRFKEFGSKRWESARIGDLLRAEDRYAKFNDDTLYRLASIRRRSGGLFAREALYGREIKTKVLKAIRAGDFIISRMQVVHGALGAVPPEFDGFFVSDSYEVLVPRDLNRIDIGFFNYLSQRPEIYRLALVSSHGVHIEKMTFVLEDFLHEKVMIPPTLEEQRRIATALKTCDDEIALLEKQAEALRDQKRGLMKKLLTGQIRLRSSSS